MNCNDDLQFSAAKLYLRLTRRVFPSLERARKQIMNFLTNNMCLTDLNYGARRIQKFTCLIGDWMRYKLWIFAFDNRRRGVGEITDLFRKGVQWVGIWRVSKWGSRAHNLFKHCVRVCILRVGRVICWSSESQLKLNACAVLIASKLIFPPQNCKLSLHFMQAK